MITGKAKGLQKGDFVWTGAFPGIIILDVHTYAPCCEVWGFEQEMGSAYAADMHKLTFAEFKLMCESQGYKTLEPCSKVAKKAISDARKGVTA